jgi:hypothetical protein
MSLEAFASGTQITICANQSGPYAGANGMGLSVVTGPSLTGGGAFTTP